MFLESDFNSSLRPIGPLADDQVGTLGVAHLRI